MTMVRGPIGVAPEPLWCGATVLGTCGARPRGQTAADRARAVTGGPRPPQPDGPDLGGRDRARGEEPQLREADGPRHSAGRAHLRAHRRGRRRLTGTHRPTTHSL